eukprot:COSAG01_NODE_3096_length_6591_cov_5.863986_8_plen_129_part_00
MDVRLDTSDSQWRRACLTKQLPKTEWLTCDRSGYSWSIEGLGLEMASDEELAQLVKDDYPEDCQMEPPVPYVYDPPDGYGRDGYRKGVTMWEVTYGNGECGVLCVGPLPNVHTTGHAPEGEERRRAYA